VPDMDPVRASAEDDREIEYLQQLNGEQSHSDGLWDPRQDPRLHSPHPSPRQHQPLSAHELEVEDAQIDDEINRDQQQTKENNLDLLEALIRENLRQLYEQRQSSEWLDYRIDGRSYLIMTKWQRLWVIIDFLTKEYEHFRPDMDDDAWEREFNITHSSLERTREAARHQAYIDNNLYAPGFGPLLNAPPAPNIQWAWPSPLRPDNASVSSNSAEPEPEDETCQEVRVA